MYQSSPGIEATPSPAAKTLHHGCRLAAGSAQSRCIVYAMSVPARPECRGKRRKPRGQQRAGLRRPSKRTLGTPLRSLRRTREVCHRGELPVRIRAGYGSFPRRREQAGPSRRQPASLHPTAASGAAKGARAARSRHESPTACGYAGGGRERSAPRTLREVCEGKETTHVNIRREQPL